MDTECPPCGGLGFHLLWEGYPPAFGRVEADALMWWLDTQL